MRLSDGDPFPPLHASRLEHGTMTLPADVAGRWAIIVFYRGHWCPYCRRQLTNFQHSWEALSGADVALVALSADAQEDAEATRKRHGLTFPVLYGLDPVTVRDGTGAFLDADEAYIQATSFILRPDGTVALAVYSTGAVGRLEPQDALGFIEYVRANG